MPIWTPEYVSAGDLIRRDGMNCGICSLPFEYSLKHSDLMAMTIDHVIPVSDYRSTHTAGNLRLTHRICNVTRHADRDFFELEP